MAEVRFEHVYKSFDQVEIVHDVSLEIQDQEFLVLVGPSGSGKSTCLRMVAGLDEPSAGRIYIGDRLVNGVDPKDRNIAMVFQNYALYPHMNVFDNVAFGLKLRHVPTQDITTRVQEAAEVLGLEHLLTRKPKQLSGGQRQRVALGRAIVRQADVFLMDEPLSNVEQSRAAAGKDLTFGIRPSHLEDVALIPCESQTGSTLDGSVDVVENLGDELLVYLTVAGRSAVAKLDPLSQVKAGAHVRLHVDNESMHLFDTATGEAIF
jgi:ABC-type sugar transport system ATPase subunit